MHKQIELNPKFKEALDLMEETSLNVFITGKAGTGKSTLLEFFRSSTKKKIVVLAPTGVAALNVKGQTIHSFFKFKPDITLQKVMKKNIKAGENIYKKLDAIIIDEISMVRADLLDCVDKFLRLNGKKKKMPFGGTQMIFIGDLYQLPPVVTGEEKEIFKSQYRSPYFFDAKALEKFEMKFVELEKIYRQKDEKFIYLLNAIRNNSITPEELENINQCYNPVFAPRKNDFYIYLTPTNNASWEINEIKLRELSGKEFQYEATIDGDFEERSFPTDKCLNLKIGAQVMFLNNDMGKRWVNGTIGKIVEIERHQEFDDEIMVELADGEMVNVLPFVWKIYNFYFDKDRGAIESEMVGSFKQYPLKLAWSVTMHKSQGKTFDKVIVDIGNGTFAHGQMYVALSRCTTLDGLVLKKKILKRHILMDWRVIDFLTRFQYQLAEKQMSLARKTDLIKKAIAEKKKLEITYLKTNDIKSQRVIEPRAVGEYEFMGKAFFGVCGMCQERGEERVFRVDRILEIRMV